MLFRSAYAVYDCILCQELSGHQEEQRIFPMRHGSLLALFLFSDRDAGNRKLICGRATRSKEWKPVWDHSFFCAVNIPEMLGWALPA